MLTVPMDSVPYEARGLKLCFDGYVNGVPSGRLHTAFEPTPFVFSALMPLIHYIDDLLDQTMHTQRFEDRRALLEHRVPALAKRTAEGWEDTVCAPGKLATFLVRINFRQNASWQGEVVWIEKKRSCFFRSALELLRMIDDVLLEQDGTVAE